MATLQNGSGMGQHACFRGGDRYVVSTRTPHLLCHRKWFASKFEMRFVERLSQQRVPVKIEQIARPGIRAACVRAFEELLDSSVGGADINAAIFGQTTVDMKEVVAPVGEEL